MENRLSLIEKPQIVRAKKTLCLVRNIIGDTDFLIVGSYARHVLHRQPSEDSFDHLSDIDLALMKEDIENVVSRLVPSSNFDRCVTTCVYNSWPKHHGEDIPEYRILGRDLTPVHLIGSLTDSLTRGLEKSSIVVDGARYSLKSNEY